MSKEKPEVGDVWENKYKTRVRVIYVDKYSVDYHLLWGSFLEKESDVYSYFLENYTYLGKSKVNIKELFDVKD